MQANLRNAIREVEFDGTWEQFKIAISNAGVAILGFRNRKHQALLHEEHLQIHKRLEDKNKLY